METIKIGDKVKNSPVGVGEITGFTSVGYPQVNYVAVSWLVLEGGKIFDPHEIMKDELPEAD